MSNQACECPFCGRQLQITKQDDDYNVAVVCNAGSGGCGARGPYQRTPDEAISAWNTRTQLRTAAAEGGYSISVGEWCASRAGIGRYGLPALTRPDLVREGDEIYLHPPTDSGAGRDGTTLAEITDAFNIEIARVSTLEFNSNEVCKAFYRNLMKRINPDWDTAIAGAAGEKV